MKTLISLFVLGALVLGMTGCSGSNSAPKTPDQGAPKAPETPKDGV